MLDHLSTKQFFPMSNLNPPQVQFEAVNVVEVLISSYKSDTESEVYFILKNEKKEENGVTMEDQNSTSDLDAIQKHV